MTTHPPIQEVHKRDQSPHWAVTEVSVWFNQSSLSEAAAPLILVCQPLTLASALARTPTAVVPWYVTRTMTPSYHTTAN